MDFLSGANALDPLKILQYRTFLGNRMQRRQLAMATRSNFWLDPKFSKWESASSPSLIWLKGDYKTRLEVQRFSIEVISMLRRQSIPVLWALKSVSMQGAASASMTDLLKGLVCQALQMNIALHTESSLALSCAQFRAAQTLKEWFDLLANVIQFLPLLYIVVDLQALGSPHSQDASWVTNLFAMFDRHSSRKWITRLKVLLVSYGPTAGEGNNVAKYPDAVVFARNRAARSNPLNIRAKSGPQTAERSVVGRGRTSQWRRQGMMTR